MVGTIGSFSQPAQIRPPAGGVPNKPEENMVSNNEIKQSPPSQGIDVKPLNDIRNDQTNPASAPEKSKGITQIQSNISQQVTGNSPPYNRLKLAGGREVDIDFDPSMFKGSNMTPEQIEEAKKKGFEGNKETYLKALNGIEDKIPKDVKTINMTMANPFVMGKATSQHEISYDQDKKTLNMPFDRFQKKPEEVAKEINDATNPELISQKKKLSDLGITWADPQNTFTAKEEIELMKTLENTASKVSPEKRPKDLSIGLSIKDVGGITGTGGGSLANYNTRTNHVNLYRNTPEDRQMSMDEWKKNLVHEYGHAIADTNTMEKRPDNLKPDEVWIGGEHSTPIKDSKGNNLFDRASDLEARAKAQGHKPDDFTVDDNSPKAALYDKFDPFVQSHDLKDETGTKITAEKYARYNKDEHFAETFEEYANNPDRFKGKISNMQGELGKLKEGTPEYNYLKESLDIMQGSYDYFKTQVFGGYEFGKK